MIGMPWSKFLLSVAQFTLLGNWILEGDYKKKLRVFIYSTPAILISIIFFIHILGLFYSSDWAYGFEDIRKKIPLLLLPLLISTGPQLKKEHKYFLVYLFLSFVLISSIVSVLVLKGYTSTIVNDARDISIFVSHIRFSLMVCLAIFFSFNLIFTQGKLSTKIICILLAIWFTYFLFLLQSLTGIIVIAFTGTAVILFYSYKNVPPFYKMGISFVAISLGISVVAFIYYQTNSYYKLKNKALNSKEIALEKTEKGAYYLHDLKSRTSENGRLIWINVCFPELREEWSKRSQLNFDSLDKKGNTLQHTLIRFLTSKGELKNGEALKRLTDKEILAIENGIPNYTYLQKNSIAIRIHQIIWEIDSYIDGENPSNHSVTQRFEYWQTAIRIIKSNLFFGVGTGDVKQAFAQEYEKMNSPLTPENRRRAHNQYLEIAVALGVVGMIIFLVCLLTIVNYNKSLLFLAFYAMLLLSMLTEDTLETQVGATFFSLFTCFFLFIYNPRLSSSIASKSE